MTLDKIQRQNDKCGFSYLADKSRRKEEKKILEIYTSSKGWKMVVVDDISTYLSTIIYNYNIDTYNIF